MPRALAVALTAAVLLPAAVAGQADRPRSGDYLFAATVDDARALWLNPAGLAVVREASVHGEFVLERPVQDDLRLAQWTVGFNSRGFSFGYQRDRFPDDPRTAQPDARSTEAFRFGVGLRFRRGALGGAVSLYRGTAVGTERAADIGVRYRLTQAVDVGAVLRNIGRPVLRDSTAPLIGVFGVGWLAVPRHLELAAEALAAERPDTTGYDMAYRAGATLTTGGRLPVGLVTALDLGSNLKIDAWAVGLRVGGGDRGVLLGSGVPTTNSVRLQRVSLSGIASRRFPDVRP